MRGFGLRQLFAAGAVVSGIALLSACAPKQVAPPPPPPPRVVIPPMPYPPMGASPNLTVPPRDAMGVRRTVNVGLTDAQKTWNLRSAYNVAALNCSRTEFPTMIDNYRGFLRTHARALTAANRAVDAEWRAKYGARFVAPREKYMTEVYNSFALPMTVNDFCRAVEAVSRDVQPTTPAQLTAFAQRSLPNIQIVFDDFNRRFEQWKIEAASWDARYAPRPVIVPASAPVPAPSPTPAPRRTR